MIENTILKANREGRKALVFALTYKDLWAVEAASQAGFDAISLDGEHGAFSPADVDAPQVEMGKVAGGKDLRDLHPRQRRGDVALLQQRVGMVVVAGLSFPEAEPVFFEQFDPLQPLHRELIDAVIDPRHQLEAIVPPAALDEPERALAMHGAQQVLDGFLDWRLAFYERLVQENPTQAVFLDGWKRRLTELREFLQWVPA